MERSVAGGGLGKKKKLPLFPSPPPPFFSAVFFFLPISSSPSSRLYAPATQANKSNPKSTLTLSTTTSKGVSTNWISSSPHRDCHRVFLRFLRREREEREANLFAGFLVDINNDHGTADYTYRRT